SKDRRAGFSTFLILLILGGCDFKLPPPPPDVFHKVNRLRVGVDPSYLVSADLNQDGKTDLVSVNSKSNSLTVLFGKGNGSFQPLSPIPVPLEPSVLA
ncbi:MAG: hypothetical protein GWM98_11765, partial [Nitrospinaceae bacterium]|nr:VCBS repeat-containing protein [Nitrospinaceae bacterium]NIR55051.1 VCBS repeat-containing protein [Nitrospinaceae bacterium]NIT82298.1 VCBS repeat-containing protein [Nitrospinaceae bacterium]NIX34673.1 hypothetical protein [Nitrospinaceae bacterium]NIY15517.1 hypothetical protein [Nitrospinaceae bacterium]